MKPSAELHRPPGRSTGQGAVYDAVVNGDAKALKCNFERLESEQQERMLTWLWGGSIQGTLHYGALHMCVTLVQADAGNGDMSSYVEKYAECVDYLRSLKAPCHHAGGAQGAVVAFLEYDWDDRHSRHVVERLLRCYIDEGLLDPNQAIQNHPNLGGKLPLEAAFSMGNVIATRMLLESGADILAPLVHTGATDIVEYARSFGEPRSDEVAALVAEYLMTQRLAGAPIRTPETTPPAGIELKGSRRRLGL